MDFVLYKVFYLIPRVLSRLMIKLLEIFGTLQLTALLLTSASCNSLPPQTNWSEAATAANHHR